MVKRMVMMARADRAGRGSAGVTFVELLVSIAIVASVAVSLSLGLTYGTQTSRMLKARTQLLNLAQEEMERIRGIPFDRLEGYAIRRSNAGGAVIVEALNERRKRVSITLRDPRSPAHAITLVTYVHPNGLHT